METPAAKKQAFQTIGARYLSDPPQASTRHQQSKARENRVMRWRKRRANMFGMTMDIIAAVGGSGDLQRSMQGKVSVRQVLAPTS